MKYRSKYQSSINFFNIYPPEFQKKLQNVIWHESIEKRSKIWDKQEIPFEKIKKSFINLVVQRNKFLVEKGFSSSVDYYLNLYKIPIVKYNEMLKNLDKVVDYCNQQLSDINKEPLTFYSEFGNHCYVCTLKNFPFQDAESVKKYIFENDKLLKEYKDKIIFINNVISKSSYNKITDKFEVYIDKNQNFRHQTIDVIHELAHIKNCILNYKNFNQPKKIGVYYSELKTLKIELELLKNISHELYFSVFGEFLKVFHRVLFEIEIYTNPNQNLDKVYALTFNKCFNGAIQISNRSFILDEAIINNPFSTLPHAIAQYKIIKELFTKHF